MASVQAHIHQRTSSNVVSLPIRAGQTAPNPSDAAIQPKSTHASDEFLRDFLNPAFDAASYLNAALPPLAAKGATNSSAHNAVPLPELSTQTQTLLSQLNAQTTRMSDTLTQLTDDILRSGSRLAYEVELLRGEALGLSETLHETLRDDINKFVPGGLSREDGNKKESTANKATHEEVEDKSDAIVPVPSPDESGKTADDSHGANPTDPEYVKQLQRLTLVRARLDSVIKVFGDAMEFVFPPSEVSVSSGFLSVSAPEPGSAQQSSEDKGQQVLKGLRDEISNLLYKSGDPVEGIEKSAARIEELKTLTTVWKDTAEERGRNKFIESLAKMVEDRHRDLMKEMDQAARREDKAAASTQGKTQDGEESKVPGGFGLLSQLQKLRNGL
ncbi:hypothetical protein E4U60_006640 [Claviceps pazoutovae]|uniref:Uncharacterized protein n=1 Tax=Claviceps pazoutovae TaxID=1649127 RepID=A0A9P7MG12_9HYPO|nr:hypothetical protein E4U60_006640 [Claviceps pazoutovae]